jgi:hypothetical protein
MIEKECCFVVREIVRRHLVFFTRRIWANVLLVKSQSDCRIIYIRQLFIRYSAKSSELTTFYVIP